MPTLKGSYQELGTKGDGDDPKVVKQKLKPQWFQFCVVLLHVL